MNSSLRKLFRKIFIKNPNIYPEQNHFSTFYCTDNRKKYVLLTSIKITHLRQAENFSSLIHLSLISKDFTTFYKIISYHVSPSSSHYQLVIHANGDTMRKISSQKKSVVLLILVFRNCFGHTCYNNTLKVCPSPCCGRAIIHAVKELPQPAM